MTDFRSYLQDVGTEANRLLTDIILGRVSEDDIDSETKEYFVEGAKEALSYLTTARNMIEAAENKRAEDRAEAFLEKGKEFSADLMYAGDA